jgi:hypothetical protein
LDMKIEETAPRKVLNTLQRNRPFIFMVYMFTRSLISPPAHRKTRRAGKYLLLRFLIS